MATDTTLVQGAYNASKYTKSRVDAAKQGMGQNLNTAIGKAAGAKRAEAEVKKKEVDTAKVKAEADEKKRLAKLDKGFSEASQKFLQSGSLDEGNYNATHDVVEAWREDYINGDEKTRGMIMNRMNNLSGDVATYKGTLTEVATMQDESEFNNGVSPERKEWYKKLVDEEITMSPKQITGDDGGQSYEMGVIDENGEWMSQGALMDLLKSDEVDNVGIEYINDLGINQLKAGKEAKEGSEFDEDMVIGGISNMIKNGKINSLVNDEIINIGKGSFKEHLLHKTKLVGMTYTDLGIPEDVAKKIGNGDDIVDSGELSEGDVEDIVKVFTTSPDHRDALEDELKRYFVRFAKKQYNKGYEKQYGKPSGKIQNVNQTISNSSNPNQQPRLKFTKGAGPMWDPQDYINEQLDN